MNYCCVNTVAELWICTKQKTNHERQLSYMSRSTAAKPKEHTWHSAKMHIHFTHNDIRLLRYYCVAGPAWFGCPNPEDKRYEINHRYEQKLRYHTGRPLSRRREILDISQTLTRDVVTNTTFNDRINVHTLRYQHRCSPNTKVWKTVFPDKLFPHTYTTFGKFPDISPTATEYS